MNGSDEQTELLRAIWNQIGEMNRTLNNRIGETNARLDQTNARLDQTNLRLEQFTSQTNENFARVQRNLESMHDTLRRLVARDERVDDLDNRLTRVEKHVGLTEP